MVCGIHKQSVACFTEDSYCHSSINQTNEKIHFLMERAYILKHNCFTFISMTLIIVNILMIAVAWTHSYGFVGSRLREFNIINNTLDSTTNYVVNAVVNGQTNETVMMELVLLDNDTVDFKYSFYSDKKRISDWAILINSKRVIGYIIRRGVEIIIVTDGNNMIYSDNKLADYINQIRHVISIIYIIVINTPRCGI